MKVTYTMDVKRCRDCIYSTNSSIEHNCPFTSAPYPTVWWCRNPKNKGINMNFIINDASIIDDKCPIRND